MESVSTSNVESASSKISTYRTMVAHTDSSKWRGAARSKLEAAIHSVGSGSSTLPSELLANDNSSTTASGNLEGINIELDDDGSSRSVLTSQAMQNANVDESWHLSTSEDRAQAHNTINESDDDNSLDEKSIMSAEKYDQIVNRGDNSTDSTEVASVHSMEEEHPEWGPMDDVELGNNSFNGQVGVDSMDTSAFEKARAVDERERRERRLNMCTLALSCAGLIAALALLIYCLVRPTNPKEVSVIQVAKVRRSLLGHETRIDKYKNAILKLLLFAFQFNPKEDSLIQANNVSWSCPSIKQR